MNIGSFKIKNEVNYFLGVLENKYIGRMTAMKRIGFIGIGNMGYAMLKGALRYKQPSELTFTARNISHMEQIKAETGVEFYIDKKEMIQDVNYIILAIKPQYFSEVAKEIRGLITRDQIVISVLPGITIDFLKKTLATSAKIVRTMPNTPALVGEGMTGISFSEDTFLESEKKEILNFFESFGKYEIVEEHLMNAVVCASGSSPAYVYMFIEALADSAVKYGLPRDKAYTLTAQTVLGAAKMVLETKEHPGKLKDDVCSPGGTTIEAVSALEEYGFRNAVIKAVDKCYEKVINMI